MWRKHWTTFLGLSLFLIAFFILLRETWDSAWITPFVKIMFGLVFGGALLAGGAQLMVRAVQGAQKRKNQKFLGS
jgi:hypothetical protein